MNLHITFRGRIVGRIVESARIPGRFIWIAPSRETPGHEARSIMATQQPMAAVINLVRYAVPETVQMRRVDLARELLTDPEIRQIARIDGAPRVIEIDETGLTIDRQTLASIWGQMVPAATEDEVARKRVETAKRNGVSIDFSARRSA